MSSDSSTSFNVYNTPPSGSDTSSLDPREKSSDDGTLVAGDYVTLNLLGSGGFASVFKAQSKEDQEFYAIKVMLRVHEKFGSQDEFIMNEINILENLRHPSIISYHGFYRTDSHYHLVQELAAETPEELNDQIRYAEVEFPSSVSPQFCTLVSLLLKKDPRERLDCIEKVLEQEFFSDVVSSLSYGF
ncbi:kinase-like domain-containing protein [Melampsora americana]|nr:kinase-like domain-containing protein [Melampsora americana]